MAHKLLDAVTATGAGASIKLAKTASTHGVQVSYTGAPTTVTVAIEGSLDGTNFFAIGSDTIAASGDMFFAVDKPVRSVRLNLTTLTGGTAPTVTALYQPSNEA